jgi:hypothetical protein
MKMGLSTLWTWLMSICVMSLWLLASDSRQTRTMTDTDHKHIHSLVQPDSINSCQMIRFCAGLTTEEPDLTHLLCRQSLNINTSSTLTSWKTDFSIDDDWCIDLQWVQENGRQMSDICVCRLTSSMIACCDLCSPCKRFHFHSQRIYVACVIGNKVYTQYCIHRSIELFGLSSKPGQICTISWIYSSNQSQKLMDTELWTSSSNRCWMVRTRWQRRVVILLEDQFMWGILDLSQHKSIYNILVFVLVLRPFKHCYVAETIENRASTEMTYYTTTLNCQGNNHIRSLFITTAE